MVPFKKLGLRLRRSENFYSFQRPSKKDITAFSERINCVTGKKYVDKVIQNM